MYIGLHVKCIYSCQILVKLEFSRQIFEKDSKTKFHELLPLEAQLLRADGRADRPNGTISPDFAILQTRLKMSASVTDFTAKKKKRSLI